MLSPGRPWPYVVCATMQAFKSCVVVWIFWRFAEVTGWAHDGPYGNNITLSPVSTVVVTETVTRPCNSTSSLIGTRPRPSGQHSSLISTKTKPHSTNSTIFISSTSRFSEHQPNVTSTNSMTKLRSSYGTSRSSSFVSTVTTTVYTHETITSSFASSSATSNSSIRSSSTIQSASRSSSRTYSSSSSTTNNSTMSFASHSTTIVSPSSSSAASHAPPTGMTTTVISPSSSPPSVTIVSSSTLSVSNSSSMIKSKPSTVSSIISTPFTSTSFSTISSNISIASTTSYSPSSPSSFVPTTTPSSTSIGSASFTPFSSTSLLSTTSTPISVPSTSSLSTSSTPISVPSTSSPSTLPPQSTSSAYVSPSTSLTPSTISPSETLSSSTPFSEGSSTVTTPSVIPPYITASPPITELLSPVPTTAADCCFVIQDSIDYRYWGDTSISTLTYTAPSTEIIYHYTQYADTRVTDVSTSIADFTSSLLITIDLAARLPSNGNAAGPTPTESELGGTATVVYAQTVTSPTNFFIYRTARIIHVPAVTDQNGHLTCVTTSTFFPSTLGVTQSPLLFPGINSNAEAYFGGATATNAAAGSAVTDISLSTPYLYNISTPATATNLPNIDLPATGVFTQSAFNELRGNGGAAEPTSSDDTSEADYGYVDPFFIKFLAQNSDYSKRYPQLAGCLPGGPSIDPNTRHANLINTPTVVTSSIGTTSTVTYVSGCFNTDTPCATTAAPSPTAIPDVNPSPPPSPQSESQPLQNPTISSNTPAQPSPIVLASSTPLAAAPSYNPNNLSPLQLSQLIEVLQPRPGTTTPSPSPFSPPSPTISPPTSPPQFSIPLPPSSSPPPSPPSTSIIPPSSPQTQPPTSLQTSLSPPPNESTAPKTESPPPSSTPTSVLSSSGAEKQTAGAPPLWLLLPLSLFFAFRAVEV